jgi:hypothetical protein
MGACFVKGLNNWDRVTRHRRVWEAENGTAGDEDAWREELGRFAAQKARYQDRFVILSRGPYSGVPGSEVRVTETEWLERSLIVRAEHESTHDPTWRLFGTCAAAIDETADFVGLVRVPGVYPDGARAPRRRSAPRSARRSPRQLPRPASTTTTSRSARSRPTPRASRRGRDAAREQARRRHVPRQARPRARSRSGWPMTASRTPSTPGCEWTMTSPSARRASSCRAACAWPAAAPAILTAAAADRRRLPSDADRACGRRDPDHDTNSGAPVPPVRDTPSSQAPPPDSPPDSRPQRSRSMRSPRRGRARATRPRAVRRTTTGTQAGEMADEPVGPCRRPDRADQDRNAAGLSADRAVGASRDRHHRSDEREGDGHARAQVDPAARSAALDAVRQWVMSDAAERRRGAGITVTVNFTLK